MDLSLKLFFSADREYPSPRITRKHTKTIIKTCRRKKKKKLLSYKTMKIGKTRGQI